ncbi:MAG TPA: hypothetical protein PLM07_08010 [Candidatus Rifleibacterium sp.]|nr:hypothetical protein [Candidatus Rifleibacterium sp.]HPT45828.1 hypothetical protein [Candidatus Rifleibacterium sp.]
MRFQPHNKKGNVTIILLGLISVMLIMVMALSKRMTGHTQLLTLSDYTQITRYFLESYAGDVLQQINMNVNEPDSELYDAFRGSPGNKKLSTKFYDPAEMLKRLGDELKIELQLPPEIVFSRSEELGYPAGFDCPNELKGQEKKGLLEIVCRAKFHGRQYSLRVQYPFTVVMRLTPVLKDFMLFVDKIAAEQGRDKIGPNDHLNIMFTKDGKHPEEVDNDVLSLAGNIRIKSGFKYRPFILLPPLDEKEYNSSELSGKVFLGPSDEAVYLNLAGDTREASADAAATTSSDEYAASVGEMFLVSPETLKVADSNKDFDFVPVFMNKSGGFVRMIGQDVMLKHNHIAKLGLLGFSNEVVPETGEIFKDTAYLAEDFFNKSNGAGEFWQKLEGFGHGFMAFSSGLKLMGIKPEVGGHSRRQIFGNVLGRFFVLTFWWPPSGGGEPLKYDETRSPSDFPKREVYGSVTYSFQPLLDSQKYQDFMSRMVSGKNWNPRSSSADSLPDGFMPINADYSKASKRIFTNIDFKANDGFAARAKLEELGQNWFLVENDPKKIGRGIESRVGKTYMSGEEFLEAAGVKQDKFKVNGVVYVKGPLKLPPLKMSNDKIGGGVVLVDGPITIDNITRGYDIDTTQFKLGPAGNMLGRGPAYDFYKKIKTEITQESFLTFVSLRGDPITIRGEALIGVHLVCLNDQNGVPYDQIMWSSGVRKEIVFIGGIACNYLNLPKRLEEFGSIKSSCNLLRAPFFLYHSAMAAEKPALAVQMMENMRGYLLTAGKAGSDEDE